MERVPCRYCGEMPPEHVPQCERAIRVYPLLDRPVAFPSASLVVDLQADREARRRHQRNRARLVSAAYRQRRVVAQTRPGPNFPALGA